MIFYHDGLLTSDAHASAMPAALVTTMRVFTRCSLDAGVYWPLPTIRLISPYFSRLVTTRRPDKQRKSFDDIRTR